MGGDSPQGDPMATELRNQRFFDTLGRVGAGLVQGSQSGLGFGQSLAYGLSQGAQGVNDPYKDALMREQLKAARGTNQDRETQRKGLEQARASLSELLGGGLPAEGIDAESEVATPGRLNLPGGLSDVVRTYGQADPTGALSILLKSQLSTGKDIPSDVRSYQFFKNLTEEQKNEFIRAKRAGQTINLGDRVVIPNSANPNAPPIATYKRNLPPEAQPTVKGAQVAAEEAARTAAAGAKAEAGAIGKAAGDYKTGIYESAMSSREAVQKANDLIRELETSDATTGIGAELVNNINRVKAAMGDKVAAGKVSDTQVLNAMMGSEVFGMIKALGVGARGLDTPAEREFMREVLTGTISLDKNALVRMAEIRRNIAERAIGKYNKMVDDGTLDSFFRSSGIPKQKIEVPKTSAAPSVGAVENGFVFLGGNPGDPKSWAKAR